MAQDSEVLMTLLKGLFIGAQLIKHQLGVISSPHASCGAQVHPIYHIEPTAHQLSCFGLIFTRF
jgi:hypothetical protein